jgi:hypothetical protein
MRLAVAVLVGFFGCCGAASAGPQRAEAADTLHRFRRTVDVIGSTSPTPTTPVTTTP